MILDSEALRPLLRELAREIAKAVAEELRSATPPAPAPSEKDHLTTGELAARYSTSSEFWRCAVKQGDIPARRFGRRHLIAADDAAAFWQRTAPPATAVPRAKPPTADELYARRVKRGGR